MDEKLRHAFQLAHFILGDEAAALRVTREAVAMLDVALAAQDRRLYYTPGSRAVAPSAKPDARFRTKVSLGELQLLQRLIYIAAEPEERRQEVEGATEAAWLIRYLKHLARITLKRNSFFVTLGVSRLLHNYTTPETMQIYELVVQDPARVRDDSYYRRRKAQLMRELRERFGGLLSVQRGLRGEERFHALPDAHRYLPLVADCLRAFTPWGTCCVVPDAFDARRDELPPLRFRGGDPDAEHSVEATRFHAVLHPDCYRRLLAALRLEAPAERLELPQFRSSDGESPPGNGGWTDRSRTSVELSEEGMERIKEHLAEQRERRKRFSPVWLRVAVDGVERARTTSAGPDHLRLAVSPDAELIEVYGVTATEELRLAAHLLNHDEDGGMLPKTATLRLEGGQQLTFDVQPQHDSTGDPTGALVAVTYAETVPLRAALRRLRRQRQRLFQAAAGEASSSVWKPALAFILLAALGATLGYLFFVKPAAPGGGLVRNATPTPSVSPSVAPAPSPTLQPSAPASPDSRPSVSPPPAADEVVALDIRSRASVDPAETLTRSERAEAVGLLEAGKLYLEVSGAEPLRGQISRQLTPRLQAGGRFSLTASRDEADIALKVSVAAAQPDRLTLTARLVDANGKVIWPLTPRTGGRRYEGPTERTIATFSRDLINDIRR
jgi:hypothetical protein